MPNFDGFPTYSVSSQSASGLTRQFISDRPPRSYRGHVAFFRYDKNLTDEECRYAGEFFLTPVPGARQTMTRIFVRL